MKERICRPFSRRQIQYDSISFFVIIMRKLDLIVLRLGVGLLIVVRGRCGFRGKLVFVAGPLDRVAVERDIVGCLRSELARVKSMDTS